MSRRQLKQQRLGNAKKAKRVIPSTEDYKLFFDRMEQGTLDVNIETGVILTLCRCTKSWRPLYIEKKNGYLFVTVYLNGNRRKIAVHRLVWLVANSEESIPDGYDVAHLDDNPLNNHYKNLELQTYKKNRCNGTSFGPPTQDELDF